jgi:vacuolar-type H+-ATPase subunit C/Vma6
MQDLKEIIEKIKNNTIGEELYFYDKKIEDEGLKHISEALIKNNSILDLDISCFIFFKKKFFLIF